MSLGSFLSDRERKKEAECFKLYDLEGEHFETKKDQMSTETKASKVADPLKKYCAH